MNFSALSSRPRAPFVLVLVASLGLALGGVLMGEFMRLAACPLCILQRMLYMLLALLSGGGLLMASHGDGRRLAALAMALAAATGVFVAGYQVWIQRFSPMTSCAGEMPWWEQLVEWAGQQVPLLFRASGFCSDPAWKFLGLSIADWSLGCFLGLLVLSLLALFRRT